MNFKIKLFSLFLLLTTPSVLKAQVAPKKPNSADIYDLVKKLNILGSVLYVAAHPDDENTRLISYMASERKVQTTYLSLTRGDGGQNLIGTEMRELLGVLRTQELLMARSVDGGKQMFSRANDFGFSKSPAETMRMWNKQEVLADVVWAIRKTQPDIIINRFSTDTTVDTHGHHTSSAILSDLAFEMAGDPSVFPEQLKYVKICKPKRLFFNTSWFFYGSQAAFDKADKSKMLKVDMGVFFPLKGKSNNEIAAESRSMHKCQGMGMSSSRGSEPEYLDYLKGSLGKPTTGDPFDGVDLTWKRVEGGAAIGEVLANVEKNFKFENPAASVSELVKALAMIENVKDLYWKEKKLAEIKDVIRWCSGLYVEAAANSYSATPSQEVEFSVEAINRSSVNVILNSVEITGVKKDTTVNFDLKNNVRQTFKTKGRLPMDIASTSPYWLKESSVIGMYRVDDQTLRGMPETPRAVRVRFKLTIEGVPMTYETDVVYRYDKPDKGELYRPFEVTPSVFVNLVEKVYVFGDNEGKNVRFDVKAGADKVVGYLKPQVPKGWKLEPEQLDFNLKFKNEEKILTFKLTPPAGESEAVIKSEAFLKPRDTTQTKYVAAETKSVRVIEYDHIPTQTVLQPSEAKVVKINVLRRGKEIGYFMGAGDDVPACLEQINYKVTQLGDNDFTNTEGLAKFDAIVVGIRAYNTKEKLKFYNEKLLEYVNNGGTLVVQYNTNGRDLVSQSFGPYPFKVGRGRTTEEDAEVRFLKPEHPVLNVPNKITSKDFEGWVQERGLYFMSEWAPQYEAILSSNDLAEKKEDGGLLVAKYGKGYYIYTGYSFFRELPAGVPGAYRLFANLLSIGKQIP